jgi:hypothetical protein
MGQDVHGGTIHVANCPQGKMSMGRVIMGRVVMGRDVHGAGCNGDFSLGSLRRCVGIR